MKRFRPLAILATTTFAVVLLTSAIPASEKPTSDKTTKVQAATTMLNAAAADGNVSYKELKEVVTELKGGKLSFKEKLGLKIFGKKISKKITASTPSNGEKSQLVAVLLCGFLGCLGIHRFYLGYTWQGVVQLLTAGGCGIWALIDFIRIITGSLQPKNGEYTTTL